MTVTARLANDLQVLKATKMILKSASCSIEEGAKSGEIGANGVNNLDLAQQFLELAYRSLKRVNEIVESHVYPEFEIDDDPEPHGARDTFVPKEACVPSEGPEPEQFNSLQD
jgi:hypothetical protein